MLLVPTLHCSGRCAEVIELYKNTICFPADSSGNNHDLLLACNFFALSNWHGSALSL